jgi:hypothetical protein
MQPRTTKALTAFLAVVALAVAGGFVLKAVWNTAKSHLIAEDCTVGDFTLDTDQAAVASTMVGAVTSYRVRLPERATVLVLAAALQESKLRNLLTNEGDRDSVGVLQQRPSQGWGKVPGQPDSIADRVKRLNDVGFATTIFLDYLLAHVPHWQTLPLAQAIQEVQRSADGSLYAQHEVEAQQLADALQGIKPAGITCSFEKPTKVASAAVVAEQAGAQLGIDTPRAAGPRTVRVPGARWQTVAWFVANANRLGIERVAYAGKAWTRADGWQTAPATSAAVVATMYDLKV